MIDDPAARAHVAAVWGVDPTTLPGHGPLGLRAARRARHRRRAAGAARLRQQHRRLGAQRRPTSPSGSAALDLLVVRRPRAVRDRCARRRRPAGHPVGRGDRHDDQPRGPGDPARAGRRPARRGCGPTSRSSPASPSGSARRCTFVDRPRGGLRRARPGLAGGRADYAGITYDRIRAEHGVFWPCPTAEPPRHAAAVRRRASRRPTAAPGSSPSSTAARPSASTPKYPVHLTTGRVLAQYQSGAQTRRIRDLPDDGPFVELHPMLAAPDRGRRRRAGRRHHPPRRAEGAGAGRRPRSGRTPSSCRSTGSAPTGSPTTRSTRPAGCRSSRSAPRRCAHDARERVGRRRQRDGRHAARRGAGRARCRHRITRARRRAAPAVQPDPAVGRARGHPPRSRR